MKKSLWIILVLIVVALVLSVLAKPKAEDVDDTLYVYFSNENINETTSCESVFPVERVMPDGEIDSKDFVLRELINGPTDAEKEEGYASSLNSNAVVRSIEVTDGTVFVDFNSAIDQGVAGSCRVIAIRSQINNTLAQFSDVNGVVISREGNIDEVLQP